jgi:hypothetical protein
LNQQEVISPFKGVITLEETTFFHVEWPIYDRDRIIGLVLTAPWETNKWGYRYYYPNK